MLFDNVLYTIKGWYELVAVTCKILYEFDKEKFENIVKQNKIHKSTFKYSYYFGNDPIICKEEKYLVNPYKIEEANCYVESCLSANRAMYYSLELIKEFSLLDRFKIEIE